MRLPTLGPLLALIGTLIDSAPARAQHDMSSMDMSEPHLSVGASGIGLFTRVSPAVNGRPLSEGYLTQPTLMLHGGLLHDHVTIVGTLNGEGWTLKRGELNPGAWGEGYVDRRHPHTYLHELIVSGQATLFGTSASLSAGKGFAAFGTDDPMVRPFVMYPVNHHLSQILERDVVVAGLRRGPVMLEGSLFNGDEPTSPGDGPDIAHFPDSWAVRATVYPAAHVEAQVSRAFVLSPENDVRRALDQRKWSASVRYGESRPARGDERPYALLEWSLTDDLTAGSPLFSFRSVLGEGAVRRWGMQLAARYEDTTRPEELRLTNPFRYQRPVNDFSIIGSTRWRTASVSLRRATNVRGWLRAEPLVELTRARATQEQNFSFFDPAAFYGSNILWALSVGARIEVGASHARMGRYGDAALEDVAGPMSHRQP